MKAIIGKEVISMATTHKRFTIITEDGKKFCEVYYDENGNPVLVSKQGKVCMTSLMQQTYGRGPFPGGKGRRAS